MSPDQLRGAAVFFGPGNCVDCHTGPALNSMAFHALGMADLVDCDEPTLGTTVDNVENRGRGGFTGRPEEEYQFKVPQLYNLKVSPFYGHGASFRTVREVIEYKNRALAENARVPITRLAPAFQPLGLTEQQVAALTVFIEEGLYDADLERYSPDALPSGQCFPNNDEQSRIDRGCL